jgi:hypothetical protein
MAMVSRMPAGAMWRWITVWQTSVGVEGTTSMHMRASFSDGAALYSRAPRHSDTRSNPG